MDNFSSTAQLSPGSAEAASAAGSCNSLSSAAPAAAAAAPDRQRKGTSDFGALAHMVKSSLGSGILAMPNAFRNGGLAFGLGATLVVGFICTFCVHLLVRASFELAEGAKAVKGLDFAETAQKAVEAGPPALRRHALAARRFVNTALLCTYYSVSCVYVVFISESIMQVVQYYAPELPWGVRTYMALLLPVLVLLCLPPDLRWLAPFSMAANACIFLGFAITLYYVFREPLDFADKPLVAPAGRTPLFFSTVIFALEGIGMVLPVANNMRRPQRFLGCPGVLNGAMGVVVALYAVIGFFGYVRYGARTEGSITLNLPVHEPLAQAVKLLVAGAVLLTYGLLLFVPNTVVLAALQPHLPQRPFARAAARAAFKVLVVALSVGMSAAVPSLGPVIALVGAVFVSTLGLLVPACVDTLVRWERRGQGSLGALRWRLFANGAIAALALAALLAGSYTSVLEILREYKRA